MVTDADSQTRGSPAGLIHEADETFGISGTKFEINSGCAATQGCSRVICARSLDRTGPGNDDVTMPVRPEMNATGGNRIVKTV